MNFLADSNITKRALASSLKELMETEPFSKIGVSDICEACEMNRKSFYYHFKDKYDLVNWIYYTECVTSLKEKEYQPDGICWRICAPIFMKTTIFTVKP